MMKKKRETDWRLVQWVVLSLWIFAVFPEINAQTAILDAAAIERAGAYEPIIKNAAARHSVDAQVLWAIAYLETRFNPVSVSRKGARGMMQFMPDTAERFGLANPHDPFAAIDAAARYVRFLANRFGNRPDLILAAYNSGETTVEAYLTGRSIKVGDKVINPKGVISGGIPPYRETQEYVARGMKLLTVMLQRGQAGFTEGVVAEEIGNRTSLVRRSIRASDNPGKSEIEREKLGRVRIRSSIYFGIRGEQN